MYVGAPVLASHRMAVDKPAAKQRRVANSVPQQPVPARSSIKAANNARETLARPAGVSDAALEHLHDQLADVLQERREQLARAQRSERTSARALHAPLPDPETALIPAPSTTVDSSPEDATAGAEDTPMVEESSAPPPEDPPLCNLREWSQTGCLVKLFE